MHQYDYIVDIFAIVASIIIIAFLKISNDRLLKKPWLHGYIFHNILLSINNTSLLIKHFVENCI